MRWPGSGIGAITAEATCRMTSTVTVRPFGITTVSRSTSNTLPPNARSVERRSGSDIGGDRLLDLGVERQPGVGLRGRGLQRHRQHLFDVLHVVDRQLGTEL